MCDMHIINVRKDYYMCTITATELKTNFGKYTELGQREEIEVTSHGKVIFTIVPKRVRDLDTFLSFVGRLPEDATIGEDPNERG